MSQNNIKRNNIKPFLNNEVININEITLTNLLTSNDSIPLIPGMYFYKNDNTGFNIINNYYIIKSNLGKLKTIKEFIDSILDVNKNDLEKIKIKREKYKLFKNDKSTLPDSTNIFNSLKFKNTLDDTIINDKNKNIFIQFTENFINKYNYNIIKNNSNTSLLYSIFQNEYNNASESKSFFKKLFKEYISLRDNLVKTYLKDNVGIMGFSFVFNLIKKTNILKNALKNKNSSINSNKLNNYKIHGKINKNSNDKYKVGDVIYNQSSSQNPLIIKAVDFKNHPDKPYLLSNDKYYDEQELNTMKTAQNPKINKIKPNLENKIDNMEELYNMTLSKNVYKTNYNNEINKLYDNLYKSYKNLFEYDGEYNLYTVLKNYIELDLNIILFLFNYINKLNYYKAIDIHYQITDNIFNQINIFDQYYPLYIEWYNILIGATTKTDLTIKNNIEISDFKSYFNKILNNIK